MDNTKLSNTPTRVVTLLAIAGAAFVGGCGNSNSQDQSGGGTTDPATQGTTEQESGGQPAGGTVSGEGPDTGTEAQQPAEQSDQLETPPPTDEPFTELGVYDVLIGDGQEATPADTVTVHYRGTLRETGEEFDASIGGEPLTLALARFVQGFSQGVQGMKVGGKRVLHIPYSMAYGEGGSPPVIPPRADLVFEVELMGVRSPQPVPPPEPPKKPELSSEFEGEPQDMGDGLIVRDIEVGEGQQPSGVKTGARVAAQILGVVAESGEQFASTYDAGQAAQLDLSDPAMLPGLARGFEGMQPGGKRRIEVPAALAFGEQGAPPVIPANADLVFEVELLSFVNPRELSTEWISEETRDNGLIVRVVKEGDPDREPLPEEAVVTLHTLGVLEDGTRFESSFDQGEPIRIPLEFIGIEGWRQGILGMQPGETRQIVIPPELAFGEAGNPPVIPPNATLTFEVELVTWEPPREFSTEFVSEAKEIEEGITIRDVVVGSGPTAEAGQEAVINYLGQLPDGTYVANTFATGELQVVPLNDDPKLIGLRKGIIGMKVGGVRRIELAPDKAFGVEGSPPIIPPNTPVVFEVELATVR